MSGIAGVFSYNIKIRSQIHAMATAIAHRGIDGIDFYTSENIAFANLKLNVSPESEFEKQPFSKKDCTITADARIDNRDELIEVLGLKPSYADCITDSEIILAAYLHWGDACLFHLVGDFAFAIWDEKKQHLFCGRDHMGVRPFYYYHKPGEIFAFASEIKALLALDFVSKELNHEKIAIYLCWLSDSRAYKEDTFYSEIVSLLPAHSLKVNKTNLEKQFCWDFRLQRFSHLKTEDDFINAFREQFTEAVRCRTRTSFNIASHLSGGLDSSSVACVASKLFEKKIITLHDLPEVESVDETTYVEEILKYNNFNHFWLNSEFGYDESLDNINAIFDRPEHYNAPCQKLLTQANTLKNQNARVLLTGLDGDSVVGHGTDILFDYLENFNFNEFESAIESFIPKIERVSYEKNWKDLDFDSQKKLIVEWRVKQVFLKFIKQRAFSKSIKIINWASRVYEIQRKRVLLNLLKTASYKIIAISLKKETSFPPYILEYNLKKPLTALIKRQFDWEINLETHKFYQIYCAGFIELIEQYNHIGTKYNFEVVHPFFDKRLVELCLVIPKEFLFDNGFRRGILRKAMIGILPEKVRLRATKIDFTEYVYQKMIEGFSETHNNFEYKNPVFNTTINTSLLQKVVTEIKQKKEKAKNYRFLNQIVRAFYFNHWLKHYENEKESNLYQAETY